MSESNRRHPNVVNLSEIPQAERMAGSRMGAKFKRVAEVAGARALGCSWFEVPPGRVPMPRHYHCGNEEAIFVLEGRGTCRIGDATVEIRPGDWVSFPIGPAHAHQVENTGKEPLRYLTFSTMNNVDVVGYPDSKKVMAAAIEPGGRWAESPWMRLVFEESSAVEYLKGEKID
jgi:uncharacterized cupin superfamily protein